MPPSSVFNENQSQKPPQTLITADSYSCMMSCRDVYPCPVLMFDGRIRWSALSFSAPLAVVVEAQQT